MNESIKKKLLFSILPLFFLLSSCSSKAGRDSSTNLSRSSTDSNTNSETKAFSSTTNPSNAKQTSETNETDTSETDSKGIIDPTQYQEPLVWSFEYVGPLDDFLLNLSSYDIDFDEFLKMNDLTSFDQLIEGEFYRVPIDFP